MRFVPYTELDGEPNVIVDGAATVNTLLTLSHWPGSNVPVPLRADLSAEIAVRYLEQPEQHVDAALVSNSHFDEDGLLGVFALVDPETALDVKDLLVDVARAGDFGWSHTRHAARVAFAISALVDPKVSPLDATIFVGDYPAMAARLYRELLPMVSTLLTEPDRFRDLWSREDEHLTASDRMIDDGDVTIVEHPKLDLAIVTMPTALRDGVVHRFTQPRDTGLHPMAVHNRTDMTRIAFVSEGHYEVQLRYETWVQLVSRRPLPRPDLAPLAWRLNELESGGGDWRFDGAEQITPRLSLHGADDSDLEPKQFVDELMAFIPHAAHAWDPWAPRELH
jgi:hypothetical protein